MNKDFLHSRVFKIVVFGIVGLIVLLFVFQAGMLVGFRRAGFSRGLGDNYYRVFGRGEPMPMMRPNGFTEAYGATGKIISVNLPTIVVENRDNVEKTILIKDDTIIREFRNDLKPADLKVNDFITVVGSPNSQSQIEAKLVRVMP